MMQHEDAEFPKPYSSGGLFILRNLLLSNNNGRGTEWIQF